MLECVLNVSEGRRADVVAAIADAAGPALLDVHRDADHHRSVITVVGEPAATAVAEAAWDRLDLRHHRGAHPRFGTVDVVPFVPLAGASAADAHAARDRFADWAGAVIGVPCFRYDGERSLPEVRRGAFGAFGPDTGPARPHPRAGACAVGARDVLVAYNVWLTDADLGLARQVAAAVRGPALRALGLAVGDRVQVSMNLIAPAELGPAAAFDLVAGRSPVAGAELVGLVPASVLAAVPRHRWAELDLAEERTIEARLAAAGLAGG